MGQHEKILVDNTKILCNTHRKESLKILEAIIIRIKHDALTTGDGILKCV